MNGMTGGGLGRGGRLAITLAWVAATLSAPAAALLASPAASPAARVPEAAVSSAYTPEAGWRRTVQPFLAQHCYACHNSTNRTADVDLQSVATAAGVLADPDLWERAVEKMKTGQMPPPSSPRPPSGGVKAVVGWIEGEFLRAEKEAKPDPGRVTARRLNRAEYNNTVRDLLGVHLEPANDFPQDDSGYGFDNIGDVLSLSPVLMEKYLTAAERVTREAIFGPEKMKPSVVRLRPEPREWKRSTTIPKEYDRTGLTLPNSLHVFHRFPAEGEYNFRIQLGGERPLASEPLKLAFWVDGEKIEEKIHDPDSMASFDIDRQNLTGQSVEFRRRLSPGQHWIAVSFLNLYEGLPPDYKGPSPSRRTPPKRDLSRFMQPPPNLSPEELEKFNERRERILARIRERREERIPANAALAVLTDASGPYNQPEGPSSESRRKIYACGHLDGAHQEACAGRIVGQFLRRAFRRPVGAGELKPYLGLVKQVRAEGDSFEEGLAVAMQAALVSPHFLFRIERDAPATAEGNLTPLRQHELASRLSYFLWSSTPDDELLALADEGRLSDPETLRAQVRRLLADPRSRALVENFGGQWLELRKLEAARPDRERFPEWDDYLRHSMLRETELFFADIVRQDASILDFIDGGYSFLNERLAKFYELPGVTGPQFRRVALPKDRRGGVVTQASVLTVSSYSTRTSPVLRGKWILDNILNSPPPPPPPDVPALDEAKVGEAASLREQLEVHRTNPTCNSCHSRLDPLGFALENYNAVGQWREKEGKFPVDASATLPDGRSFRGPAELKKILRQDAGLFTEALSEKLLTYGLGRGLERYDRRSVREIAEATAAGDYRFSRLIIAIVESLPFRMKRGEQRA